MHCSLILNPSVGWFPKAEQQPFALEQCLPACRASMAFNLEICLLFCKRKCKLSLRSLAIIQSIILRVSQQTKPYSLIALTTIPGCGMDAYRQLKVFLTLECNANRFEAFAKHSKQ